METQTPIATVADKANALEQLARRVREDVDTLGGILFGPGPAEANSKRDVTCVDDDLTMAEASLKGSIEVLDRLIGRTRRATNDLPMAVGSAGGSAGNTPFIGRSDRW